MTSSFDPEGLWLKSKMFINRSVDGSREFEESAFWATSALELLGKCALARVSPLLIANPMDDGKSILAASGLVDFSGGYTSVQAKAVWSRCARAFKPFSESEAKKLSYGRNEYIHAAGVGFDAIPEAVWWPSFWAQASILLNYCDKEIADYVGASRAPAVEHHIAANKEHLARRYEARVERAKSRLLQHQNGSMSARVLAEWEAFVPVSQTHAISATCPACERAGRLGGDEQLDTRVEYGSMEDDSGHYLTPSVTLIIGVDSFCCPTCHLVIDDWDLLTEGGFEETIEVDGEFDDVSYEPDYNNE